MIPRRSAYFLITFYNLIPLIGYFVFDWDLTLIFLFYAVELSAYELVMIPQIIIYAHTCGEYTLHSAIKKIGLSISWLLYHLMLYVLTLMFLLHTAFVVSPAASAPVTMTELWFFADQYIIAIVLIFVSYLMEFFTSYLGSKEYNVVPSEIRLKEIAFSYLILLVALALINVFASAFTIDNEIYQVTMMLVIIGFKTTAQVLLRKSKLKYII